MSTFFGVTCAPEWMPVADEKEPGGWTFHPVPIDDERVGFQFAICEARCCGFVTVCIERGMYAVAKAGGFEPQLMVYWPAASGLSTERHAERMSAALTFARSLRPTIIERLEVDDGRYLHLEGD